MGHLPALHTTACTDLLGVPHRAFYIGFRCFSR